MALYHVMLFACARDNLLAFFFPWLNALTATQLKRKANCTGNFFPLNHNSNIEPIEPFLGIQYWPYYGGITQKGKM